MFFKKKEKIEKCEQKHYVNIFLIFKNELKETFKTGFVDSEDDAMEMKKQYIKHILSAIKKKTFVQIDNSSGVDGKDISFFIVDVKTELVLK